MPRGVKLGKRVPKIKRQCAYCHKDVWRYASQELHTNSYCDRECLAKAKRYMSHVWPE